MLQFMGMIKKAVCKTLCPVIITINPFCVGFVVSRETVINGVSATRNPRGVTGQKVSGN